MPTQAGGAFRRLLQIGVAFLSFFFFPHRRAPIAMLALAACIPTAWALPTYDEVRADFRPSDTEILSAEGEVLQRLRTDATVRRGQWVPLADVSPALRQALVLSEDKRFFERSFESFRSYYQYLPKGTVTMEYTVRLNNVGDFALPPSRVEAMYAPEMFGEYPNARVKVVQSR